MTKRQPQVLLRGINARGRVEMSGDQISCHGSVMKLTDYRKDVTTVQYCMSFKDCKALIRAPDLPATILSERCYEGMFSGCTSLVSSPDLPATILSKRCYEGMFSGCTSLVSAPELPATTLAESCCNNMFKGCTSLVTVSEILPATTLAKYCCQNMFKGCKSLVTVPKILPATTLVKGCYNSMFRYCSNLKSVTALFEKSLTSSLNGWLTGVSSIGTFYKNAEAVWENSGIIPDGWDVVLVTP